MKVLNWITMAGGIAVALLLFSSVHDAESPSVHVSPIKLKNISGMAWDGAKLWITVDGEGMIYRVDPESGRVERRLPFASRETAGSAWDGSALWQIAYKARTISRLDPASGRVMAVIPTPGPGECSGMTFDGTRLWVANYDTEMIYAVMPRDGRVVAQISGNRETTGLAWDDGHLWAGFVLPSKAATEPSPRIGFIEEIDPRSQQPLRAFPLAGVAAGTADTTPRSPRATRMWWYDGYHERVLELRRGHGRTFATRVFARGSG
jgi:streptogramin lyase